MPIRIALLTLVLTVGAACQSNGLVVETVKDYAGNRDLEYSHADGDGFINALMGPDSNNEWNLLARWKDHDVYDTDFIGLLLEPYRHCLQVQRIPVRYRNGQVVSVRDGNCQQIPVDRLSALANRDRLQCKVPRRAPVANSHD